MSLKLRETGACDQYGKLTDDGRRLIIDLRHHLCLMLVGHMDNTGGDCRIDLDGHDCCYTCNMAEDALTAVDEEFYPDGTREFERVRELLKARAAAQKETK